MISEGSCETGVMTAINAALLKYIKLYFKVYLNRKLL